MANDSDVKSQSLSDWLIPAKTWAADNGVLVQPIVERAKPPDLNTLLADELRDARFPPEFVADCAAVLGISVTSDIMTDLVPKGQSTRRGYFGETIATCCLRDFDGCRIPVQKLRSMISSDQSLPGIDILGAHVVDDRIEALVFAEAKLRTTRQRGIVLSATNELLDGIQAERPNILISALIQLQQTNDPMYSLMLDYLQRRRQEETEDLPYVYLVLEAGNWTDGDIDLLDDLVPLPNRFRVTVIEIQGLAQLVDDAYRLVGLLADQNDDE